MRHLVGMHHLRSLRYSTRELSRLASGRLTLPTSSPPASRDKCQAIHLSDRGALRDPAKLGPILPSPPPTTAGFVHQRRAVLITRNGRKALDSRALQTRNLESKPGDMP